MGLGFIIIRMGSNIMGVSLWAKSTGTEFSYSPMEQKWKGFGITIIYKDLQRFTIKMGITTRAICICHRRQERESIGGITLNRGRSSTRGSLIKITWMDLRR